MNEVVRVLHVVTRMERCGLESRIMDIYRNVDRNKIQFDFLTHRLEKGDYDNEILSLGGRVYYMPGIKPWSLLNYIHRLNVFFNEHHEYRIVHVHLNSYSAWALYAAKKIGVPVRIAHSRNSGMDCNWKMVFKAMSKLLVNKPVTHKFACSYQAGEWLFGKKGIMPPNIFMVIPNGFELSRFSFSQEIRKNMRKKLNLENNFAVVHVGRLSHQKNHKFLVEVFNEICKIYQSSRLFLLGEGELRGEIERQIANMGLTDKVVFLGNRPNVGDYLQAMDVMIFPSFYEGFPTTVMEAQCNGLLTLASDTLVKEVQITECLEFMSIKNDSPKDWAKRICAMYRSIERKDRTDQIRQEGYDIKDTYKLLSDFYLRMGLEN